jgi:hypothetical protein
VAHPDDDSNEVELSEELEGGPADSAVPTDSSIDLRYAGEAPEADAYEAEVAAAPRDLSGFADDAGADASYGFDNASETARYSSEEVQEELAEDSNLHDSGEFNAPPGGPGVDEGELSDRSPSAEDSGESLQVGSSDSLGEEELAAEVSTEDPYAPADLGEEEDDDEAPRGFSFVPEPEPEPEPEPAPPKAAPPKAAPAAKAPPTTRMAPPAEEDRSSSGRPGQIGRNALDDIFSRAAKLKKKDPN